MSSSGERGSIGPVPRLALLPEPWLDKRGLADHLACSVRSIQTALTEGMPHAVIFGRCKFRVSEVEPWLEAHHYLVRHGGDNGTATLVAGSTERAGGADNAPAPDTEGVSFDASTQA
jgi:hypothetical protein